MKNNAQRGSAKGPDARFKLDGIEWARVAASCQFGRNLFGNEVGVLKGRLMVRRHENRGNGRGDTKTKAEPQTVRDILETGPDGIPARPK